MVDDRQWPGSDGPVLHLVPLDVWEQQCNNVSYRPEAYEHDGFIHCTIGAENAIAVGNLFYTGDHRPYLAVQIDIARIKAPVRFEDDAKIYPHIYGELPFEAIERSFRVVRAADGSFIELIAVS